MARDRKPVPKNQSEIVQPTISAYLPQGKPSSESVFSQPANRGKQTTRRTDNIKDIAVGIEDIDYAIKFYFDTVIKPTVVQDGNRIAVPVIYGSPERWKSIQADGYYRDTNDKLVVPLIMYKKTNIEKNRFLGNKIDGNLSSLFQVFETKYNQRNAYDKFSILNNRIPSKQYYVSVVPDYVTISYECVVFTNFIEQNNKLIEAIEFAADSYWGDANRWQFRTMIDSFATTNVVNTGEDRVASTTMVLKVNGYLVSDSLNKTLADSYLHYSPSRITFTLETTENSETFTSTTAQSAPKTSMGASSFADSYNKNVTTTTIVTGVSNDAAVYLGTSKTKYTSAITSNTATFSGAFLTAPYPLPTTSVSNFTFFVNGQLVDANAINSFTDNGLGSCILSVNTSNLGYSLETDDQIVAIGKFA
jgi:hypothetical protein